MRLKLLVESPLWKTSCLNHQYCYDIGGNVNSLTQVLYCCLFQQLSFFKLNIGAPREALYCKVSAYIMHYLIIWKWKSFVVEFSLILSMIVVLNAFGGYETSLLLSDPIICIIGQLPDLQLKKYNHWCQKWTRNLKWMNPSLMECLNKG